MPNKSILREQIDKLSHELLKQGVATTIQTIHVPKYGFLWVPCARVKLKIYNNTIFSTQDPLFTEIMPYSQRYTDCFSVTLLVPATKIEGDLDDWIHLLVKYLFLRYEIVRLLTNQLNFPC